MKNDSIQKEICDSFNKRYLTDDEKKINKLISLIKDAARKPMTEVPGTMAWILNLNNDWFVDSQKLYYYDQDPYKKLRDKFLSLLNTKDVNETESVKKVKYLIIPGYDKRYLNMGRAMSQKGYMALLEFIYSIISAGDGYAVSSNKIRSF